MRISRRIGPPGAIGWVLCLCAAAGIARAADVAAPDAPAATPAATPTAGQPMAEQVKALRDQYSAEQRAASMAYSSAKGKSDEERIKIYMDKAPKPLPFAQKAMALARQGPKDPAAADALIFVNELSRGGDTELEQLRADAIDQLTRDHLDEPNLANVFSNFVYQPSKAGDKLMQLAAERSKSRDVRGSAIFWRAQSLKNAADQTGDAQQQAEAKKLFQQVLADYADVRGYMGTLGDGAASGVFEIDHLAIGKVAPDIEGKDANGKPMKLSDYRDKVVVLDFWGDW